MTTITNAPPALARPRAARVGALLGLALALALAGCGSSARSSATPSNQPASGQASAQANGQTSGSAGSSGAAQVADKLPNLRSDPLIAVPSNLAKVELQIYEVRRSNGTATLGFALHNTGTTDVSPLFNLGAGNSTDAAGASLVDAANLKRYLTLKDEKGGCACSSTSGITVKAGDTAFFYATFTAPPPSVTRIAVETPMGSVAGVPITDA